jgi:hypothetical protein
MCRGWEFNYSSTCAWVEGQECVLIPPFIAHIHIYTNAGSCAGWNARQNLLRNEVNRDFRTREKVGQEFRGNHQKHSAFHATLRAETFPRTVYV